LKEKAHFSGILVERITAIVMPYFSLAAANLTKAK
jgi:hypothetical protein